MGRVQIMVEQKIHTTPLGVQGWDGPLGTCPRGWARLSNKLYPRLQLDVDHGPPKVGACREVDFLTWFETFGLENYLSKDGHLEHLPRFDEDCGVHGKWRPSAP